MQKDSYDAARVLLLDTIRGLRVRGEIVAMIPNREALLFAGSDDLHALKHMLKWVWRGDTAATPNFGHRPAP